MKLLKTASKRNSNIYFLIICLLLITNSCDKSVTLPEDNFPEEVQFIPHDQFNSKAKSTGSIPPEFGCTLSTLNDEEDEHIYRYQSFYIQFPKRVIEEAKGNIEQLTYLLSDESQKERTPDFINTDAPVRFISCKMPASEQAVEIIKEEMQKFGSLNWANENSNDVNDNFNTTSSTQNGGEWVEKCTYTPTGASVTLNPGKPDEVTIYFFNKECEMIYVHGGDSGGSTGGDGGGDFGGGGGDSGGGDNVNPCGSCEPHMPCDNQDGNVGCDVGGLGGIEEGVMKIILDESFINTKAECVYNKLNNLSTSFAEAIQKFDGEFPVSHLKFMMDNLGSKDAGEARPPIDLGSGAISPDYVITLALNNNTTSQAGVNFRPNLMIAKTLAHEVMHAEMFRKLMSLTQEPNFNGFTRQEIIGLLSNGDYPGIYNYYREYETNWQHQQMAQYYRQSIAKILQEYDTGIPVSNNQQPNLFYMDLAWEGLMSNNEYSNVAWEDLSSNEQERVEDVISDYIVNNKYEGCQK